MSRPNQHKYVLLAEREHDIREWQFSRSALLSIVVVAVIALSAFLFISADYITDILYRNRLKNMQSNYRELSTTLVNLQNQLESLTSQLETLEEKDEALRTYADLPEIDQDVRKLGVGGYRVANAPPLSTVTPDVKSRISELELDIDKLSRKVKLELASYTDIYDKVRTNINMVGTIPSIRPVEGGYLNSGFGYRKDPLDGKVRFHYGQDITVHKGTPIRAPADGIVRVARYRGGYGNVVKISHGLQYTTIYAHMSAFNVKKGQKVKRGDIIGWTGNTGRSTAPHLHYEVHSFGVPQNPLDFFFSGYLD